MKNDTAMTNVKNHREYEINGKRYYVERYADKPNCVWFWRYGGFVEINGHEYATIISYGLSTRPYLKRLSL